MAQARKPAVPTRNSLALLAVLASGAAGAAAQEVRNMGAGVSVSCGAWLQARAERRELRMAEWALGYISGAATYGRIGNPLGGTDPDGVLFWLDGFCRSTPTRPFFDAVDAFIAAHGALARRPQPTP